MSEGGPNQLRFDDGKEAQALRTIGEVAKALGLRQHVLRYWEQQFPMLQPLKRSGGRRYYRPEDVALVQTIDRLVNREGYTLKGARQALAGGAEQPARAPSVEVTDILPNLRAIRARLAQALEAA
jgi:DNA-binding transcriptional MerR regulator